MMIRYLSLGGIILDDVVFPDGRTAMNRLGGGGLYAAVGMRLWSNRVGLFARVGPDFDFSLLADLSLDGGAVRVNTRPTPRAWQLYEEDGTRIQIPRVSDADWQAQLKPTLDRLPRLKTLRGIHMAGRGHRVEREVVAAVADSGTTLSLEPILEKGDSRQRRNAILDLLPYVDIFSPSLSDAYLLLGERPIVELLTALADRGPRFVNLRRGAVGSVVYDRVTDCAWQVPAARANVVDVTGAGNAYCGGFLAGWGENGSVEQAAACAAVSAALIIEQIGPPAITPPRLTAARQRQIDCLAKICKGMEQVV